MNENETKNKYVTEEYLDKRLAENNQILLGAMDSILAKRLTEMKEEFKQVKQVVKEKLRIEVRATM